MASFLQLQSSRTSSGFLFPLSPQLLFLIQSQQISSSKLAQIGDQVAQLLSVELRQVGHRRIRF